MFLVIPSSWMAGGPSKSTMRLVSASVRPGERHATRESEEGGEAGPPDDTFEGLQVDSPKLSQTTGLPRTLPPAPYFDFELSLEIATYLKDLVRHVTPSVSKSEPFIEGSRIIPVLGIIASALPVHDTGHLPAPGPIRANDLVNKYIPCIEIGVRENDTMSTSGWVVRVSYFKIKCLFILERPYRICEADSMISTGSSQAVADSKLEIRRLRNAPQLSNDVLHLGNVFSEILV